MKKIFLIIFLISFQSNFAQDSTSVKTRVYIPISQYKKLNKPLTDKDSLNFMFRNGDTLVLAPNDYEPFDSHDGVRVPFTEKDSSFLKIYKSIVYPSNKNNSRKKSISRLWVQDVKIYFEKTVPLKHREGLMGFAKDLSRDIDSLNIVEVNKRGKSNYLIYYLNTEDDYDFDARIINKEAGYFISWNGKQQFTRASLKVDTRNIPNEEQQLNKLKKFFFGSLGFFSTTDMVPLNSLISRNDRNKEITDIDREILKYHYDFGICKGTSLESFEESHEHYWELKKNDPNSKFIVVHPKDYFKKSK